MTKIICCDGELALLGFTCVSAYAREENPKCAYEVRPKLFLKCAEYKCLKPYVSLSAGKSDGDCIVLLRNCEGSLIRQKVN